MCRVTTRLVPFAAMTLLAFTGLLGCGGSSTTTPVVVRPPPAIQTAPLKLIAVGDILLGHDAQPWMDAEGIDYSLRALARPTSEEELLIGNLEGPLTLASRPIDPDKAFLLRADPAVAPILRDFGFEVLSLANNHTLDFRRAGLLDTQGALAEAGISSFGAGLDRAEAEAGVILERAGLRIGFLGFCQPFETYDDIGFFAKRWHAGVARLDASSVQSAMAALRPRVDVLVVAAHWGDQYLGVTDTQRDWARRFVELGADLVLGHHPHVAQGVGTYRGVPILYSLGNFAFGLMGAHHRLGAVKRHGWIAEVTFHEGRASVVDLLPILTDNLTTAFQPRPGGADVLEPMATKLQAKGGRPLEVLEDRLRLQVRTSDR